MTDAAIIYRTHFDAIRALPKEQRADAYEALISYCLNDETPEEGLPLMVLTMAKPVLDKWKKKREAGASGGTANGKQAESKPEANAKQNGSKPEANAKQNGSKPEANVKQNGSKPEADEKQVESKCEAKVKERVKEKDNKKESSNEDKKKPTHKTKHGEYGKVLLTDEELQKLIDEYGQEKTQKAIKRLDEYIAETGKSYKSHYLTMKRWVFNAVEEDEQKTKKSQTVDMSQMPRAKPAAQNRFNNFDQRQYDFPNLEQTLLAAQRARDA